MRAAEARADTAHLGRVELTVVGKRILTEPVELLRQGRLLLGGRAAEDEFFAWNYKLRVLAIGPRAAKVLPELAPGDLLAVKEGHGDSVWYEDGEGFNYRQRGRRLVFVREPEHISHGLGA